MAASAARESRLTVYQGKCAIFLAWSQPFIYRLLKSLEPHVRQVVLCQRVENQHLFPMPVIERLNVKTLFSPYHARRAAARLQRIHHGRLIHAHFGYSGVKLLLLKQMMCVPMVVTFGGKDLTVHAARPRTQDVYRILFEVAEQLVAVSDDLRRRAMEIGCPPEKIVTVRRGVDLGEFSFVDRRSRPGEPVNLLMVSRLVRKKGHADALAALAALPADAPDWRLRIVGEGEEKAALRRLVRRAGLGGRVAFLGRLPVDRVREEMARADLLVHPSVTSETGDREGIPNVVIEGQARGLPVVGTRHGGIGEAVRDGRTGLLVAEHDVPALSGALARLMRSREERLKMGRAAAEWAAAEFALERQAERYVGLYRELVERFPPEHPRFKGAVTPVDVPALLKASRAEAGVHGDLSLSELFENLFISEDGDSEQAEPWWYAAFWRLKRFVPTSVKYPVKKVLFRVFRRFFAPALMKARRRDREAWEAFQRGKADEEEHTCPEESGRGRDD